MLTLAIRGRLPSGMRKSLIEKLARAAYKRGGGKGRAEMSVSVVSDARIRQLNRRYRGKDKVTDVLSFGFSAAPFSGHSARGLHLRPRRGVPVAGDGAKAEPAQLGDVFISLPQVRRQAERIGRSASTEFALMVVHGTLHLMGYDHESLAQERRMFGLQHAILARAGII